MKNWNKTILWSSVAGALLASIFLVVEIFRSTNSTAVIGFLFLPFFAVGGAFVGAGVGFCLDSFIKLFQGKIKVFHLRMLVSYFLIIATALGGFRWWQEFRELKEMRSSELDGNKVLEIYRKNFLFFPESVLEEILKAKNLPLEIQQEIFERKQPGELGRLAENPNISDEIFFKIADLEPSYEIHYSIAGNPKLDTARLDKLLLSDGASFPSETHFKLYQTYVLAKAAKRKDLSKDQFRKIVKIAKPEPFLLYALLASPYLECGDFSSFDSQSNPALETAIQTKRDGLSCK